MSQVPQSKRRSRNRGGASRGPAPDKRPMQGGEPEDPLRNAKVERLRRAIEDGSFTVDIRSLVEDMLG